VSDVRFVPGHRPPSARSERDLWFVFSGERLLVVTAAEAGAGAGDAGVVIPRAADLSRLAAAGWSGSPAQDEIYLGALGDDHCWAADLTPDAAPDAPPPGFALRNLRTLLDLLPVEHVALAGRAAQVRHWERTHQFCGSCGTATTDAEDERAKVCPACGRTEFPRISPAVIVAVVRDGAILLARGPRFRKGMYGVLAGFVEPGESLEDCVHREIREEVGIEVTNLRYFGSQPWPFPDSLMIAFVADHAGGEIRTDDTEIHAAAWYRPGELPDIPSRASIARRLIDWFVSKYGRGPGS